MRAATGRRKQLEAVSKWLMRARPALEHRSVHGNDTATFQVLIAVEQLVVYLKMLEEEKSA